MALFSFRHSVKTFSEKRTDEARRAKPGQTAAHLKYITRPKAARVVIQERLSGDTHAKTATMAEEEAQRRKGRVCERFVVALPVEATPEQREALTRAFADRLSHDIAGYVAAIHDMAGNDTKNPHAHFVFFDVQVKTGGRGRPKSTLGLARKNAIENAAKMWADLHNEMMRAWGYEPDSEITQLSFMDQGIDRIPMIHEGAGARAAPQARTNSKEKWQRIDQGHSRAEANTVIRQINQLKKEQEDAGTTRLGTGNGDNQAQRSGGVAEQRARGCRDGQAATGNRPPFQQAVGPDQCHRQAGSQPGPADRPHPNGPRKRPGRQPPFLAAARLDLGCRFRRRRGIRRIFLELIMLRDTLRARLLPDEGQCRSRDMAPRREILAARSPETNKPCLGKAERSSPIRDP